jgi:hypothetical protein
MAADAKEPNRKSIRGLDNLSNKAFNDLQRSKARAAELGMTYEEFFNESYRIKFMALRQEITMAEHDRLIAELHGQTK